MSSPFSFSKDTPNKIGEGIDVSGKNTLIKTKKNGFRVAIGDEPIDAKVDGKKLFCIRVDNWGTFKHMMIGFTPMKTFDSSKNAWFGFNGFTGCGMDLYDGYLHYPVSRSHMITRYPIPHKAKEIIVILTISNNGTKKEIRFLRDGYDTKSTGVSEILKGDLLFPAICLNRQNQKVTTIPIDEITKRTPEIEELIKEYQEQQQQTKNQIPSVSNESNDQVISQLPQQIESNEQQLQREREISNKQLELERAENQQLRNLLQQKNDEMSAMEIHYLKRESGQRREREEEFKVMEKPEE
jgi:hypothetical protein